MQPTHWALLGLKYKQAAGNTTTLYFTSNQTLPIRLASVTLTNGQGSNTGKSATFPRPGNYPQVTNVCQICHSCEHHLRSFLALPFRVCFKNFQKEAVFIFNFHNVRCNPSPYFIVLIISTSCSFRKFSILLSLLHYVQIYY